MLGSGGNSTRGSTVMPSEMPPLTKCLPLEPITLGNKKCAHSGELRRALGVPCASMWEDHSFRATHSKPSPPVVKEELKHIKESVQDSSNMARDRLKLLDENIFKLDKYTDAVSSKKRQRGDHLSTDRLGVAKLTKIGSQIHRNFRESMPQAQGLEERAKNVGLNKRTRTSALDGRVDNRPSTISRQRMVMDKDEDRLHAGSAVSVRMEEKIRRLPTGGEGWDKKVKKKRSIGAVSNRVINPDQDVKRAMHGNIIADPKLRSGDAQGFRLKSAPGICGIKLEGSFEPSFSNAGTASRSEPESVHVARDRTTVVQERIVAKANNKSNVRSENHVRGTSTLIKAKISRAPRTGSVVVLDSFQNLETVSEAQGWEQPTFTSKIQASGEGNNPKKLRSAGSSSHPMAQWIGQRPHNSRMRRSNSISPSPKHVETRNTALGIATSDFSARTSYLGTNGSLLASSVDNDIPKFKRKRVNVSSPVGLSESEESGPGEERIKGKETYSGEVTKSAAQKIAAFALAARKNEVPANDTGDGMRRQERSGRCSSLTRPGIPPWRKTLDNRPNGKPLQAIRPSSDKSKSKSGRPPSNKLKDRKAVIQVVPILDAASSGYTGGSDDDQEELYAAANSARNASNTTCSGPFWKKMQHIFAPVSSEDASYLMQQLSFTEELDESLSAVHDIEATICSAKKQEKQSNQESACTDVSCGIPNKVTPLYQTVLSALIEEGESEEFFHHSEGKSMSLQYVSDDSHCGSCNHVDSGSKEKGRMEFEVESRVNYQSKKNCLSDKFSCTKRAASNLFRSSSSLNSLHSNETWQGDDDATHSGVGLVSEICQDEFSKLQQGELHISGLSLSDSQYENLSLDDKLMLELESIGLYTDTLPDLAEDEVINQDIMELKEELYQQVGKKKKNLKRINIAIENGRDEEIRNTEQIALDQLIELAYRKQLACFRGGKASKIAAHRVSRQAALAFVKRSLARCRKYEDTGSSCFGEAALHDVIFSCNNDAKSVDCVGSGTASNTYNEVSNTQEDTRGSGTVCSTSRRHGPGGGNLDRGSEEDFFKNQPVFKKGKKREMLIDDVVVGSASSSVTSVIDRDVGGGVKRKRSQRGDGPSLGMSKCEGKIKAKPDLKNNHLLNSGSDNRVLEPPPHIKNIVKESSEVPGEEPMDMELHELDTVELGVPNDLSEPQDLTSWLNFDEDGLQDHDSIGLEIPMDDLSELMLM